MIVFRIKSAKYQYVMHFMSYPKVLTHSNTSECVFLNKFVLTPRNDEESCNQHSRLKNANHLHTSFELMFGNVHDEKREGF